MGLSTLFDPCDVTLRLFQRPPLPLIDCCAAKMTRQATHGASDAPPQEDFSPGAPPAVAPVDPASAKSTVKVYVCDYNGTAMPVKVPVGATLIDVVNAALEMPSFAKGVFLGFENGALAMDAPVTGEWTADNPLKVKYKVKSKRPKAALVQCVC